MKIGFSGTRLGMSDAQTRTVRSILAALAPCGELHHGDCVGAEAQMHRLFDREGKCIAIHPPNDSSFRAWCAGPPQRAVVRSLPPAPYLTRNRAIVNAGDVLLAGPREMFQEGPRSGTWATVRYARSTGKPLVIVRPDGFARAENVPPAHSLSAQLTPWTFPTLDPRADGYTDFAHRKVAYQIRSDAGVFVRQAARLFGVSKDDYTALENGSLGLMESGWNALFRTLENWPVVGSTP